MKSILFVFIIVYLYVFLYTRLHNIRNYILLKNLNLILFLYRGKQIVYTYYGIYIFCNGGYLEGCNKFHIILIKVFENNCCYYKIIFRIGFRSILNCSPRYSVPWDKQCDVRPARRYSRYGICVVDLFYFSKKSLHRRVVI